MKVKLWRRVFAASMSAVMLLGLTDRKSVV